MSGVCTCVKSGSTPVKGFGQVRTETDEGERQRLDKGLVWPELGLIGFNNKGIER